jgi:putative ABC transport system ATP-binding protein
MALLALTLAKQSGHVSLAGQDWDGISRRGRDGYRAAAISTILQDPLLMPHLTVEENVLSRLGYVNRAHLDRAHKLLSAVGLAELAKSSVTELSGGERSRVSMARGLMSSPKLIVADEPTSGLDRANKDRVLRSLRDAVTEALNEVTPVIIIATHDQDVMSFADRAIALEK